jgi:hypothetical protein
MNIITISRRFGITIFILLISLCSFSVQAGQSYQDAVQAEAKRGGYKLIDLDTLQSLYQNNTQELLLVDTRQEWEYHSGFIKGAVNFPLEPTWLARMTQRGALEQFLGPDKSKTLVFY